MADQKPVVAYESNVDAVIKATANKLAKAAELIGQSAETHAKQYVTIAVYETPQGWYIRTSNLKNGITHQTEQDENGTTVVVGTDVEYAPYVELGTGKYAEPGTSKAKKIPWHYQDEKGNWHTTSGMPARPFLRPAIEIHLDEYRKILEDELKSTE